MRRANHRRKVYGITPVGPRCSTNCWPPGEESAHSTFGWPSPATFLPSVASDCWSNAGPFSVNGWRNWQHERARRDDRYMRILAERQHESLSLDVSWLDRLIQEERAGGATPGPSGPAATAAGAGAGSAAAWRPEAPSPPEARLVPLASASQLQRAARGLEAPAPAPAMTDNTEPIKDGN